MEENLRPDPDKLLSQIKKTSEGKSILKIFFGMSAGVGKTYTMLKEAHLLLERGEDVVIGWIEPHGRKETEALITGIEAVPFKIVEYRGITMNEIDIDAILARKPAYVLIDEMAHTNVPGLKHPKRYQDIQDLLDAGIHVYTTVNIQHLESFSDVVEELAGIRIQERIPDMVFDRATRIQLVDIPPEELIRRLQEGKVYTADKSIDAVANFFKKENLAMLREIAFRYATQLASHQLEDILRDVSLTMSSQENQQVLVPISQSPNSEYLIRWARRFTYNLKVDWTCIFIETGIHISESGKDALTKNMTLARNLGAHVITIPGNDIVKEILDYARQNNISTIIVGKSNIPGIPRLFRKSDISKRLLQKSGRISVIAVQEKDSPPGFRGSIRKRLETSPFWQYIFSLSIIGMVTVLNLIIIPFTGYWSAAIIYLAGISFLGLLTERRPLLLAAMISALLWNYLFIPPIFTFVINKTEDILGFIFYFILAISSSWMTSRLKRNERMLKDREQRMRLLNELSDGLEDVNGIEKAIILGNAYISKAFKTDVNAYLKKEDDTLLSDIAVNTGLKADEKEYSAALYCFTKEISTGRFTSTLPTVTFHYVPMTAPGNTIGVIGIKLDDRKAWTFEQESFLLTLASTISLAVQREILYERNRKNMLIRESERLSKILLNSITHEIRTPLAVIQGSASELRDYGTAEDKTVRAQLIDEILTSTGRLNIIVENLLSMNRLESGRLKLKIVESDPEDILFHSLRQVESELGDRVVELDTPGTLPPVPCDILLIIQVLVNCLRNSIQYSEKGTPITIKCTVSGNMIRFSVLDHGPGVRDNELPHLFEKFFRGQSAKREGVGLGLSICKGIVEAHRGTIIAKNRPEYGLSGNGLCVEISLPLTANYGTDEDNQ